MQIKNIFSVVNIALNKYPKGLNSLFSLASSKKFKIKDYLQDLSKKNVGEGHFCHIKYVNLYFYSYYRGDKTRAFLKDYRDFPWSYFCTIPLASGNIVLIVYSTYLKCKRNC